MISPPPWNSHIHLLSTSLILSWHTWQKCSVIIFKAETGKQVEIIENTKFIFSVVTTRDVKTLYRFISFFAHSFSMLIRCSFLLFLTIFLVYWFHLLYKRMSLGTKCLVCSYYIGKKKAKKWASNEHWIKVLTSVERTTTWQRHKSETSTLWYYLANISFL